MRVPILDNGNHRVYKGLIPRSASEMTAGPMSDLATEARASLAPVDGKEDLEIGVNHDPDGSGDQIGCQEGGCHD